MARWIALILDGPIFLLRVILWIYRAFLMAAIACVTVGMAALLISLLLRVVGIRWGY